MRTSRVRMYGVRGGAPGIRVVSVGPRGAVTRARMDEIRQVARCYEEEYAVTDEVMLFVAPAPAVRAPDGKIGFGFFAFPVRRGERVAIAVAGEMPKCGLVEKVIHELLHYDQWRRGVAVQERGMRVRTRSVERMIRRRMRE